MDTVTCVCGASFPAGTAVCDRDGNFLNGGGISALSITSTMPIVTAPTPTPTPPVPVTVAAPPAPEPPVASAPLCTTCFEPLLSQPCPTCFPATAGGRAVVMPDGARFELRQGVALVLGREVEDDAVSRALEPFVIVSRRHVRLTLDGESVRVEDLGSTNGTFLDDRRLGSVPVTRPLPLTIRLGSSVRLEVR